jgi:hypothetical protein
LSRLSTTALSSPRCSSSAHPANASAGGGEREAVFLARGKDAMQFGRYSGLVRSQERDDGQQCGAKER